jgi:hypothetical protein
LALLSDDDDAAGVEKKRFNTVRKTEEKQMARESCLSKQCAHMANGQPTCCGNIILAKSRL